MSAADIHGRRRNSRWGLAATLATATCFTVAPSAALADPGLQVTASMPATVVGAHGVGGSLTVTNTNTPPETAAVLCNAGDPAPCPAGGTGITLVPSCQSMNAALACVVAEPGVFAIGSSATGAAGTACAGLPFTAESLGDGFGTVRFSPPAGSHITLQSGEACGIDFTADVVKVPAGDVDPAAAGAQTFQIAAAGQRSGDAKKAAAAKSSIVTVGAPPPPPPPPAPPTPPALPPTVGSTAPEVVGSSAGPGSAKISGPEGCVTKNFHVTVTGKRISKVTFRLDRKVIKTLTRPNVGTKFRIAVRPGSLKRGTHRITATTTFTRASGTRARTLRVVFQRCSRSARSPQFTG